MSDSGYPSYYDVGAYPSDYTNQFVDQGQGYNPTYDPNFGQQMQMSDGSVKLPGTKPQRKMAGKVVLIMILVGIAIVAVVALVLASIAFARSNDDNGSSSSSSSSSSGPSYDSVTNVPLTPEGPISGSSTTIFNPNALVVLTGATPLADTLTVTLPSNPRSGATTTLVNYSDSAITVQGDGTNAAVLDFNQSNSVQIPGQGSLSLTISKNNGTGVGYWFVPS